MSANVVRAVSWEDRYRAAAERALALAAAETDGLVKVALQDAAHGFTRAAIQHSINATRVPPRRGPSPGALGMQAAKAEGR